MSRSHEYGYGSQLSLQRAVRVSACDREFQVRDRTRLAGWLAGWPAKFNPTNLMLQITKLSDKTKTFQTRCQKICAHCVWPGLSGPGWLEREDHATPRRATPRHQRSHHTSKKAPENDSIAKGDGLQSVGPKCRPHPQPWRHGCHLSPANSQIPSPVWMLSGRVDAGVHKQQRLIKHTTHVKHTHTHTRTHTQSHAAGRVNPTRASQRRQIAPRPAPAPAPATPPTTVMK